MKKSDKKEWFCVWCEVLIPHANIRDDDNVGQDRMEFHCEFCGVFYTVRTDQEPKLTAKEVSEKWQNICLEDRKKERTKKKWRAKSVDIEDGNV